MLVAIAEFDSENVPLTGNTSMSGGGLTWTKRAFVSHNNVGFSWGACVVIFTAPVTTGASMTVTASCTGGGASLHCNLHVFDATGYDTSTPVDTITASNTAFANGAMSMSLSSAPPSTGLVIAARAVVPAGTDLNPATPGASYTELYDTNSEAGYGGLQSEYRTGSTSTTVDWVTVGSDTGAAAAAYAIVIREGSGAAATSRSLGRRNIRSFRRSF